MGTQDLFIVSHGRWSVELPLEPFRSRPVWASVAVNWVLMAGGAVTVAAEGDTTQVRKHT